MKPHTVNAFGVIKLIEMSRNQFTIFYCLVENILVILLASMKNGYKVFTQHQPNFSHISKTFNDYLGH